MLKMDAADTSEMFILLYQNIRVHCHITIFIVGDSASLLYVEVSYSAVTVYSEHVIEITS
jgi:hypothetical protein